jgi:hypothetical protein
MGLEEFYKQHNSLMRDDDDDDDRNKKKYNSLVTSDKQKFLLVINFHKLVYFCKSPQKKKWK